MSSQSRQPAIKKSSSAREMDEDKGAYGARINQLFRDAMRDLKKLKQEPPAEQPD